MDLHRRRSVLVRMTEDGQNLDTARLTNSPAQVAAEIRRAVVEGCNGWYWAADALAAVGAEVYLAHPLGVKAFRNRRVKNDELDARDLFRGADLLPMSRLAEAWIAPQEIRELREVTRYRGKLVSLRTSHKLNADKARARGKTRTEALRLLRRRLSDTAFSALRADERARRAATTTDTKPGHAA